MALSIREIDMTRKNENGKKLGFFLFIIAFIPPKCFILVCFAMGYTPHGKNLSDAAFCARHEDPYIRVYIVVHRKENSW